MSSETSQINAQRQVSALTYINDKNIQAFKVENIKSFIPSPGQHSPPLLELCHSLNRDKKQSSNVHLERGFEILL